jgi:NTE family protein
MTLLDTPDVFEQIARNMRGTSVFRHASRYDLARLLGSATLKNAVKGDIICVPDQDPNAPPSPSFFILLTGEFELDGETRLSGPRDGLVGVEDVIDKKPRSIALVATTAGTYLEITAGIFLGLIAASTPLRQTVAPVATLQSIPMSYVAPAEIGAKGNIVQFSTDIQDMPLSLLMELLGRRIATDFADYVLVLRSCPPGMPPSPAPIQVPITGLGALFYAFVDPNAMPDIALQYSDAYDYIFLDNVPSVVVDILVKLFFGYPQDYQTAPPIGSPRILQTSIVGLPSLPCSGDLYYVNANPAKVTHSSDCKMRLDLPKVRALAQSWNAYAPVAPIDAALDNEVGVWARALTHRRTGFALAGGGVWSMQSVYIIRELVKRKVPLDIITGASAGAMIGGYFSVLGLPGLDLIVERGDSGLLDVVVALWMVLPCFGQAFFEHEFGANTCLSDLGPDFRPNSTNLTIGEGVAITRGNVATAVRAAASAPPLVAPTFSRSERFVDGAFSNNVAVQILPYFGANLTFGANTYPPSRRPKPTWVPDVFTRISSLGPINRLFDFTVALNLLANLTGRIEGGYADVAFNATSNVLFPFLTTTDFTRSSEMVSFAETDPAVNFAIDDFTARWEHSRRRGRRTWTTMP